MHARTYRAERFDHALDKIKRELGPDAIIVSSRQLPGIPDRGGKPCVEVKAVSDRTASDLGLSPEDLAARWKLSDRLTEELRRAAVSSTAARNLTLQVRRMATGLPERLRDVQAELTAALADMLDFGGSIANTEGRTVVFVGPTGVGKTTTIAKLAAQAALIEHRRVGLICLDQYRLGGDEQLARYAQLIGIPMLPASDGASLKRALGKLARAELILLDTAGRAPRDRDGMFEMLSCFEGAREPVNVCLCLQAATREAELESILDRMSLLRPARLLMTKLDEAVAHGSIVTAQLSSSLPLNYFTTGQRVPEDIELASPERLAELICRGGFH